MVRLNHCQRGESKERIQRESSIMKKLVSLSLFAIIVILALLSRNVAHGQEILTPVVTAVSVLEQPLYPTMGNVRARWSIRRPPHIYFKPYRRAVRMHLRPMRNGRVHW